MNDGGVTLCNVDVWLTVYVDVEAYFSLISVHLIPAASAASVKCAETV